MDFDANTAQSLWQKVRQYTRNNIMGWTDVSESDANYLAIFTMIAAPILVLGGFVFLCAVASTILWWLTGLIFKVFLGVVVFGGLGFCIKKLITKTRTKLRR